MSAVIVYKAAALYCEGRFAETVQYVEDHISELDEYSRLPAFLQAFYAARDSGLEVLARRYALEIAKEYPDMPTVHRFLHGQ